MKSLSKGKHKLLLTIILILGFVCRSEFVFADTTEDNLTNLHNQQEQLLNVLTELDELIESNYEKNKTMAEKVNENTNKLVEESNMYITILEELDVLNKVLNEKSDSELIYEYDEENKLKAIKSKNTNMIIYEFDYDDNGNLLQIKKH